GGYGIREGGAEAPPLLDGAVQYAVEQPLDLAGPRRERAGALAADLAVAEHFVRQVQRREDGDPQRVVGLVGLGGQTHLLVDVRRQLRDVGRVQRAPDRIALSVDDDRDDAFRGVGHRITSTLRRPERNRYTVRPS